MYFKYFRIKFGINPFEYAIFKSKMAVEDHLAEICVYHLVKYVVIGDLLLSVFFLSFFLFICLTLKEEAFSFPFKG